MNQLVKHVLIGASIGLSTSYLIITIILLQDPTLSMDGGEMLREFILAVLLGISCGVASMIFTMEHWSMLIKLIIHYIVILSLVLTFGAIGGWYPNPIEQPWGFVMFIFIQLVIYFFIFMILYWMDLQAIKKINEKLRSK